MRLLPSGPPVVKGFDFVRQMVPARAAGGDYFDYLRLPSGHLGLTIADVSGKGVSVALLMSSVKMALWAGATLAQNSSETVTNLNKSFCELTDTERYATLFYGRLDPVHFGIHQRGTPCADVTSWDDRWVAGKAYTLSDSQY